MASERESAEARSGYGVAAQYVFAVLVVLAGAAHAAHWSSACAMGLRATMTAPTAAIPAAEIAMGARKPMIDMIFPSLDRVVCDQ
jgi:hypothetical protein